MKRILLFSAAIFCFINFTHAQAGQLDPSFGNHGIVTTDLGKNYTYPSTGKLVLSQIDGSTYLIFQTQSQAAITKRRPDGSIDSSYGVNGFSAGVQMDLTSAVLQSDGKTVLAGYYNDHFYSFHIILARFNTNGSLDSTFDGDGVQSNLPFRSEEGNYYPKVTVLQDNEKIVVCGGSVLARYTSDGEIDSSFGEKGKLEKDFIINGGAIQNDGKIVLTGYTDPSTGDPLLNIIARYKTDGSADSTFGNNGKQTSLNLPQAAVIQPDGKIVVGGASLERYKTDGSLDSSFSDDGIAATDFNVSYYYYQGYSISLATNGKIVVTGNTADESNPVFTIVRDNTNGSIDTTFSGDGRLTSEFKISGAAVDKDNRIVIAGTDNSQLALARYTSNGTSDNTFGKNGKITDSLHSGYTVFTSIAAQKDGRKVVAGRTWNGSNFDFIIVRYDTNGAVDSSFNSKGVQKNSFAINAAAIQSDGKIVVVGSENGNFSVARYNTDGSPDKTFSTTGKRLIDFDGKQDNANTAAIQSDGKIVIAGSALITDFTFVAIARLNPDGSLDKTFDGDGKQTFVYSDQDDNYAASVVVENDGKIVVAGIYGSSDKVPFAAKLNTDGSLDNTFNHSGKVEVTGPTGDYETISVAVQRDGKIVVGNYSYYRGNNDIFVSRFNTDGSLDTSFAGEGYVFTGLGYSEDFPVNDFANTIAIEDDGKILVLGSAIARYNTNGSLDSTFGSNGIVSTPVSENNTVINAITVSKNKLYSIGWEAAPGIVGLIARYLLDTDSTATPPAVKITTPTNNATYLAPAAHIKLSATASDSDGTITKVEFYKDSTLLHTETVTPYGYVWRNVPLGNYTLTAKAYDNSGNVSTSAPVHISVLANNPPIVSVIKPANNQTYTASANIRLEAAGGDTDGRITRVEFYKDSTLLRTEYKYPYTYNWPNVAAGTYTITAKATDNFGRTNHISAGLITLIITKNAQKLVL